MTDPSLTDRQALRALASSFDALHGQLPVIGDVHRAPNRVTVGRQIADLGKLIADLGDRSGRADTHVGEALSTAGEATSALGDLACQLAFLDETESRREWPDQQEARQDAVVVIEDSIETAEVTLRRTANYLYLAAGPVDPLSARLTAARSRSTVAAATASPIPPAPTAASPVPSGRSVRNR